MVLMVARGSCKPLVSVQIWVGAYVLIVTIGRTSPLQGGGCGFDSRSVHLYTYGPMVWRWAYSLETAVRFCLRILWTGRIICYCARLLTVYLWYWGFKSLSVHLPVLSHGVWQTAVIRRRLVQLRQCRFNAVWSNLVVTLDSCSKVCRFKSCHRNIGILM